MNLNRDRIEGVCRQLAGRFVRRWGTLTRDADAVAAGTHVLLIGRIQEQRGLSKQAADRQLEEFLRRNRNWWILPGRRRG